ncbi:MAG: hypothetical protein FWF54_06940 [Candidatus Azobacteroides sp.]|nr:hypothetical protein [Candidatus Azobacteroides sp.]
MTERTLDYFQKRIKEAQDFFAGNPEMEILEKLKVYREKAQGIINEIQAIPEKERGYELSMILVKACVIANDVVEAIIALIDNKEGGKNDPLWYYYMGHCFQCHPKKPKYDVALKHYQKFLELATENNLKEEDRQLIENTKSLINNLKMMIDQE